MSAPKPFKKKMWAVVNDPGRWVEIASYQGEPWTKDQAQWVADCYSCCRVASVLVTEIKRKKGKAK